MKRRIKLVMQEPGDDCCGPAVVASFCGIGLHSACYHLESWGKTRLRQMREVLRQYGWTSGPLVRSRTISAQYAIALIRVNSGPNHWVGYSGGQWLDPERGRSSSLPDGSMLIVWVALF